MKNPFKKPYFVSAVVTSKKKGQGRKQDNYNNCIINLPIWHKKDYTMLANLSATFASNIAEQKKDHEILNVVIISLHRV